MGEMDAAKKKNDGKKNRIFKLIKESVSECEGHEALKALFSLADNKGGGFGGDTSDNTSTTYVHPDATNNKYSEVEYDYSDYYEEEENGKERRDAEKDYEELYPPDNQIDLKKKGYEKSKILSDKKASGKSKLEKHLKKAEYYDSIKNVGLVKGEEERIQFNMIRSVPEGLENINFLNESANLLMNNNRTDVDMVDSNLDESQDNVTQLTRK